MWITVLDEKVLIYKVKNNEIVDEILLFDLIKPSRVFITMSHI